MVRALALALGVFILFPLFSSADVCPSLSTRTYDISSHDDAVKKGLEVVGTGDKCGRCADFHVTFKVSKIFGKTVGASMTVAPTRLCRTEADLQKYGCKAWCPTCTQEPKISLTMSDGSKTSTKSSSRCDENLPAAVTKAVRAESADPFDSLRQPVALNPAGPNKDAPLPAASVITKAVEGIEAPPDVIKKVEQDPAMLKAVASGNPAEIEARAKALGLDAKQAEELAKNATALNPNAGVKPDPTKIAETPGTPGPQAQNMWPATTYGNPTESAQEQNKSSSSNLFSQLGSMLQNLFKNFKMPSFGAKKDEKKKNQNQQTHQQTNTGYTGVPATTTPFAPELLKPIMAIIPQRREVQGGEAMFVSWSSVRVLSEPRCTLSISGAAGSMGIGQGNNGVQTVPTSSSMSGNVLFTLKCFSLAKEEVTATTSVTIL